MASSPPAGGPAASRARWTPRRRSPFRSRGVAQRRSSQSWPPGARESPARPSSPRRRKCAEAPAAPPADQPEAPQALEKMEFAPGNGAASGAPGGAAAAAPRGVASRPARREDVGAGFSNEASAPPVAAPPTDPALTRPPATARKRPRKLLKILVRARKRRDSGRRRAQGRAVPLGGRLRIPAPAPEQAPPPATPSSIRARRWRAGRVTAMWSPRPPTPSAASDG